MMDNDIIQKVRFSTLKISDPFFDSLRQDYAPNLKSGS